ncbi:MAG: surface-adhesin E family protein [Vitreoscilla sp.]
MSKKALVAMAAVCLSTSSMAATWYTLMTVGGDNFIEFFDADSVVKAGSTVTIWEKTFYDLQTERPNGTYSFAARTVYNCKARTIFTKTESSYGRSGNFIRTINASPNDAPTEAIPGTNGDDELRVVCDPDFPRGTNTKIYAPTPKNDVTAAAQAFYDYLRAQKADPAPK